jgi:hypothetical protein
MGHDSPSPPLEAAGAVATRRSCRFFWCRVRFRNWGSEIREEFRSEREFTESLGDFRYGQNPQIKAGQSTRLFALEPTR